MLHNNKCIACKYIYMSREYTKKKARKVRYTLNTLIILLILKMIPLINHITFGYKTFLNNFMINAIPLIHLIITQGMLSERWKVDNPAFYIISEFISSQWPRSVTWLIVASQAITHTRLCHISLHLSSHTPTESTQGQRPLNVGYIKKKHDKHSARHLQR